MWQRTVRAPAGILTWRGSVVARDLTSYSVASWLGQIYTSYATNSLSWTKKMLQALQTMAPSKVSLQAPSGSSASLFKNILQQQKQQTPTSLLDMCHVGVLLTTSTTHLSLKALFSNTILSQVISHAASSTSLMSFEAGDDW